MRYLSYFLLIIGIFIPSLVSAGQLTLPDDKIDTADKVFAVNNNFSELYRGKLDLRPGHVIPKEDDFYDIGSSTYQWRNLYTGRLYVSTITARGPFPWVDAAAPPYNVACDGVTDDLSGINAAIAAANGGEVRLPSGNCRIVTSSTSLTSIDIDVLGTILTGVSRRTTTSTRGTTIVNDGTGDAIRFKTGVNNGTVQNLAILGNSGSRDGIRFETGSAGHARLINLWIEVQNDGISTVDGDGVHVYVESVRIYGGNIPFNFTSTGTAINTVNAINSYAQNATSNCGWKIDNVQNFNGYGLSSDNNFYGYCMEDTWLTCTGCDAENNTSKGFYGTGVGAYTLINPYTDSQTLPFELNTADAGLILVSPRTDSTPSGASINIANSNYTSAIYGRPVLDGGFQGSSQDHIKFYPLNNDLYIHTSTFTIVDGKVGIGTSNPSQKLHISSGAILVDGTGSSLTVTTATIANLVGVSDGSDACATCVGYFVSSVTANFTNFPTSGNYGDLVSLTLAAGDWRVNGALFAIPNGATVTDARIGISTTSGNSATGLTAGYNFLAFMGPSSSFDSASQSIPNIRFSSSSSFTVYLKYRASYTVATPQTLGSIWAERVR